MRISTAVDSIAKRGLISIRRRHKRRMKILISTLVIIFVLIVGVVVWQWGNINALITSSRYSSSDLQAQLSDTDQTLSQAVRKLPGNVQDLSDADKEKLKDGEITEQQAADIMTGTSDSSSASGQIDALIAKLYILDAEYNAKLKSLVNSAVSEYKALPASERASAKYSILMKYEGQASNLEKESDASVNSILSQLKPLLSQTGGDMSLTDDIQNAYTKEKSLRKAYYISLYRKS